MSEQKFNSMGFYFFVLSSNWEKGGGAPGEAGSPSGEGSAILGWRLGPFQNKYLLCRVGD